MKQLMDVRKYIYAVLILMAVITACSKRIDFVHPTVIDGVWIKVSPYWGLLDKPNALKAIFYNEEGFATEFEIPVAGGEVYLPNGNYKVITYNPNVESVTMSNLSSFENAKAVINISKAISDLPQPGVLYSKRSSISTPTSLKKKLPMASRTRRIVNKLNIEDE